MLKRINFHDLISIRNVNKQKNVVNVFSLDLERLLHCPHSPNMWPGMQFNHLHAQKSFCFFLLA